jgi:hypothetical protein
VLANSTKSPGRCVAGIEILSETPEGIEYGGFIRPIDATQKEGALRVSTTTIDGHMVKPLDLVEMEVRKHAEDPNHPEDWIIYQGSYWRHKGRLSADRLEELPHSANDIWGKRKAIEPGTAEATVQVIKTASPLTVRCFPNTQYGYLRIDKRLLFNGLAISITDTEYAAAHNLDRMPEDTISEIEIPRESYLVMSLTPPFEPNGCGTKYQYRVVAAIIENHA